MHNLTLIESERPLKSEPLSYFEHNAQRTLPQDKEWLQYYKKLLLSWRAAQLEEGVRQRIALHRGMWDNHE